MNPDYIDIGSPEDKVIEECSELIKSLCKCKRFGWDHFSPITGVYNFQRVLEEIENVELSIKTLKEKIKCLQ